jgi:tripartite-type tricarboxylate transporter receptor subunit TctC
LRRSTPGESVRADDAAVKRRNLLLSAVALAAGAQAFPARPVRIIVAYPPGGVSDEIARALADKLAAQLGVPVLVEHRAGAGGAVAMDMLARAAPDGHTLCFSAISPLTLLPHLGPVGYYAAHDIAPVISVMFTPVLVVGTPALSARSFEEMIAIAREHPGTLRWATSGTGTTGHLVLERVRRASGADLAHIPYKGGGQQLNDALGGQFEVLSTNVGPLQLQHVRSGKFTPLAVGAPARLSMLPQVPTLAELGYAQANLVSLFGVFAPARTPQAILRQLNSELDRSLRHADIRQRLLAANNVPTGGSIAEFARHIARESEANRRMLEEEAKR